MYFCLLRNCVPIKHDYRAHSVLRQDSLMFIASLGVDVEVPTSHRAGLAYRDTGKFPGGPRIRGLCGHKNTLHHKLYYLPAKYGAL